MRRTPLKPGRRASQSVLERRRAAAWWDEVMASTGGRCAVHADVWAVDCHHCVEKRQLKSRNLHAHLWDARNGIPLCRRCHERNHTATERVPRASLPSCAEEFAAELGLDYLLDRMYGAVPS